MKDVGDPGVIADILVGANAGYRAFNKKYDVTNPLYEAIFDDLSQNKVSISPRIMITIGYIF